MDKDYREATYPASPGTTNIEAVLQHDVLFMITRIGLGSQIEMRMWHLSLENEAQLTQLFDPIILTSEPTCLALAKLSGEVVGIYASASEPGYVYTLGKYGNVKELALCRGDVQCAGQFPLSMFQYLIYYQVSYISCQSERYVTQYLLTQNSSRSRTVWTYLPQPCSYSRRALPDIIVWVPRWKFSNLSHAG